LADAPDLGSGLERGIGSNPFPGNPLEIRDLRELDNNSNAGVAISLPFYCLFGKNPDGNPEGVFDRFGIPSR
jgi:hypothetical protein